MFFTKVRQNIHILDLKHEEQAVLVLLVSDIEPVNGAADERMKYALRIHRGRC